MGRQSNKTQKRARRARYNERKKEAVKAKATTKAKKA